MALAFKGSRHECEPIVSVQRDLGGRSSYQVPEPWRGDIRNAPLLFVSSNPSIDLLDDAPWSSDAPKDIKAYYERPLITDNFPKPTLRYEHKKRLPDVKFWRSVGELAAEIFGTEVEHGKDYAITEVVHCKSRGEHGVDEARETCSTKFLRRILEYSGWKVLVVLGEQADRAVKNILLFTETRPVVYLAHPSARASKSADQTSTNRPLAEVGTKPGKAKRVGQLKKAKTLRAAELNGQIPKETVTQMRTILTAWKDGRVYVNVPPGTG